MILLLSLVFSFSKLGFLYGVDLQLKVSGALFVVLCSPRYFRPSGIPISTPEFYRHINIERIPGIEEGTFGSWFSILYPYLDTACNNLPPTTLDVSNWNS